MSNARALLRFTSIVCLVPLLVTVLAIDATAHLGGTASVDQIVRLERVGDKLIVRYELDMAEFPSQMLRKRFDRRADRQIDKRELRQGLTMIARECMRGLIITIDGQRVKLKPDRKSWKFDSVDLGTAAVPLRIMMTFTATLPPDTKFGAVVLENRLYADHEVGFVRAQLTPGEGFGATTDAKMAASIARYEKLNLNIVDGKVVELSAGEQPPQHRRMEWTVAKKAAAETEAPAPTGPKPAVPKPTGPAVKTGTQGEKAPPGFASKDSRYFWDFFKRGDYSMWTLFVVLAMAFIYGMGHALTPGHGKAITGAFLIGNRGTVWDAIVLGITVTVTHTIAVFALGIAADIATGTFRQDRVMRWLEFVSAGLIIALGLFIFLRHLWAVASNTEVGHGHSHFPGTGHDHASPTHDHNQAPANPHGNGHDHEHAHAHGHAHDHGHAHGHDHVDAHDHAHVDVHDHDHDHVDDHDHAPGQPRPGIWQIIYLGITGGMIPCPTGLVIISLAFRFQVLGLGLLLATVFSLGMAAVLVTIGVLTVKGYAIAERYGTRRVEAFFKVIPILSGLFITIIGFAFLAASMGWMNVPWLSGQ